MATGRRGGGQSDAPMLRPSGGRTVALRLGGAVEADDRPPARDRRRPSRGRRPLCTAAVHADGVTKSAAAWSDHRLNRLCQGSCLSMKVLASLRTGDHRLTKRMASWDSPWARDLLPPVEDAAEHTKLWWAAAAVMAAGGGWRGRKAATAGVAGMALAELLSKESRSNSSSVAARRKSGSPTRTWRSGRTAPPSPPGTPPPPSRSPSPSPRPGRGQAPPAPYRRFWWRSSACTTARITPPMSQREQSSGWLRLPWSGPCLACCCAD